jgi:hypothetical protein
MAEIKIVYSGAEQRLAEAVDNANTILSSGNLLTIIRARKTKFFNTTRSCDEIAQAIADCGATINLKMFTEPAENGWITTAYVEPKDRDIIHYNTEVAANSVRSQTNTLVHEAVHVVDIFHDRISGSDFTHDGNDPTNPPENTDSAPYWIGDRAEDLVDLLDDHVGEDKSFLALQGVEFALVERYVMNVSWAARRRFRCGTV